MKGNRLVAALLLWMRAGALAQEAPVPAASRGELFYSVHGIAAQSTQMPRRETWRAVDRASIQVGTDRPG
jgi:hypothetical protein